MQVTRFLIYDDSSIVKTSRQELPSRGKFNAIVYINTCKILIY